MSTEVHAFQARLEELERRCERAESRYHHAERRFRVLGGLGLAAVVEAILISPGNRTAFAQSTVTVLQQIYNRLNTLETKTQFISIGKDGEMHIAGTNLHIENG